MASDSGDNHINTIILIASDVLSSEDDRWISCISQFMTLF